jgi:hypothetical protein
MLLGHNQINNANIVGRNQNIEKIQKRRKMKDNFEWLQLYRFDEAF